MREIIDLTTPALLFPAISLLMLAYTNRFITLAGLVRELHSEYQKTPSDILSGQIHNLQQRIAIIKYMQIFGAMSFFFCVVSMFLIFAGMGIPANYIFGLSLLLLLLSLALLIRELQISINALNIQLKDFDKK
jgi:hypothetical protein